MDLRVEKTRRSIINGFLELRARKPLEKIRVRELCEKAQINKSTFYDHYRDVYDLAEQLEDEAIRSYLDIAHPEYVLTDVAGFVRELFASGLLVEKLAAGLTEMVLEKYPDPRENPVFRTVLTYRIYGGYYAFQENRKYGEEMVIELIGRMAQSQSALKSPDQWGLGAGERE